MYECVYLSCLLGTDPLSSWKRAERATTTCTCPSGRDLEGLEGGVRPRHREPHPPPPATPLCAIHGKCPTRSIDAEIAITLPWIAVCVLARGVAAKAIMSKKGNFSAWSHCVGLPVALATSGEKLPLFSREGHTEQGTCGLLGNAPSSLARVTF